ncbi:MAG: hypothetical protein AAGF07_03885 [Patescibacteria group bacterium]
MPKSKAVDAKPSVNIISKEEYIKETGQKSFTSGSLSKPKGEILASLSGFPEIDTELMWSNILDLIRREYKTLIGKQNASKSQVMVKQKYINSFQDVITSLFMVERIDTENNVAWIRDIFNPTRLYPVLDIALTQKEHANCLVFHKELLPILQNEKGLKRLYSLGIFNNVQLSP